MILARLGEHFAFYFYLVFLFTVLITLLTEFRRVWEKQVYVPSAQEDKLGSGTGIKMLLNGDLSFAQSSRNLKQIELQAAKEKGFALEEKPVAIDGIAIYVNLGLPIKEGLTLQQLQKILTGETKNWKEVGGPDRRITVFIRNPKARKTVDFFKDAVLHGNEFGSYEEVQNVTQSLNRVAKTLGGIGNCGTTSNTVRLRRKGASLFL